MFDNIGDPDGALRTPDLAAKTATAGIRQSLTDGANPSPRVGRAAPISNLTQRAGAFVDPPDQTYLPVRVLAVRLENLVNVLLGAVFVRVARHLWALDF